VLAALARARIIEKRAVARPGRAAELEAVMRPLAAKDNLTLLVPQRGQHRAAHLGRSGYRRL